MLVVAFCANIRAVQPIQISQEPGIMANLSEMPEKATAFALSVISTFAKKYLSERFKKALTTKEEAKQAIIEEHKSLLPGKTSELPTGTDPEDDDLIDEELKEIEQIEQMNTMIKTLQEQHKQIDALQAQANKMQIDFMPTITTQPTDETLTA